MERIDFSFSLTGHSPIKRNGRVTFSMIPGWVFVFFILQEITISLLYGLSSYQSLKRLKTSKALILRKLNAGTVLLGIGVILRSAAIFVPVPLGVRVLLWQAGEILFLGAWHFMFNHDFRELEDFVEARQKIQIHETHDGPPTQGRGA